MSATSVATTAEGNSAYETAKGGNRYDEHALVVRLSVSSPLSTCTLSTQQRAVGFTLMPAICCLFYLSVSPEMRVSHPATTSATNALFC